jgi:hypothetical protein
MNEHADGVRARGVVKSPSNQTIRPWLVLAISVCIVGAWSQPGSAEVELELAECLALELYLVSDCAQRLKASCSQGALAKASPEAQSACVLEIDQQVAARVEAQEICITQSKTSACSALSEPGASRKCTQDCHAARDRRLRDAAEQAQRECEAHFVAAQGSGKFACTIAGADRSIDKKRLATDFTRAMREHDELAMDALLQKSERLFAADLEKQCTQACRKRGPQLIESARAEAQAKTLIASYDLCMVKADGSEAARKLDASRSGVYCGYLSKADAKCRRASRCDWLETLTDVRCRYASAAVASCRRD